MNNLDWLCENDREALVKIIAEGDECEYCAFEIEDDCGVRCSDGITAWLEAERNDGLQPENGVSDPDSGSNVAYIAQDTREKLEADATGFCEHFYTTERRYDELIALLDRQKAIAERELCKGCDWPYLAAQPDQEAYDRIAVLEAELEKRDKGIARLKAQRDEARAEREALRKKLGEAISHAQAIAGLAEVDR